MTREEAIEMLKSKLDGKTDTSYEWVEAVGMAIKALEDEGSNAVEMLFPKDWRDFLDYYCFKDTEEIYTNGSYLVQKLRAEQALEHYADGLLDRVLEIIDELKSMEDGLEERANSIGFVNHTPTGNIKAVEHLVMPRNPNEIKVVKLNAKADGIQYAREYLKSAVLALNNGDKE